MTVRSTTEHMPPAWRVTVTIRRPSEGRYGYPGPPVEHEVGDCLVSAQRSVEEAQARSDAPETTAWLYGPAGADFASVDTVVVPESPYWPSGTFHVSGEPSRTPMGVVVPLRR